jgi:hypothetical protein
VAGAFFRRFAISSARSTSLILKYATYSKTGEGTQSLLRDHVDLTPHSPSFLLAAAGSAEPAIRVLGFAFTLWFLSAGVACGAPQSQSASLLPLVDRPIERCGNDLVVASPPPLFISAHLAFYSAGLACPIDLSSSSPVIHSPEGPSQKLSSPGNAQGPGKAPSFEHVFFDRENALLFAAVGASRTLDYFSTLNFRRRGRNEALLSNDIVDHHAEFASIEAAATLTSIGVSYLFHRYHHHRLERWTSIVHASLATSGAARNYCLKTAHP